MTLPASSLITDDVVQVAIDVADIGRKIIAAAFRQQQIIRSKADHTLVTELEVTVESSIRTFLGIHRPDDAILGEELGFTPPDQDLTRGMVWIIDPIDGTKSFIGGRPTFVLLIGLIYHGLPQLGIIDQPILNERWLGVVGRPTLHNGCQVHTRKCPALDQALISATTPLMFNPADRFMELASKSRACIFGGDGYAYGLLAAGFQDLIVEAQLQPYDFVALPPIVEGAGGIITDWNGLPLDINSQGQVVASGDPRLHRQVLDILASG